MNNDTLTASAYARAGLLGNPSDGYNGKTISIIVRNFSARVSLSPHDTLRFVPLDDESGCYESISAMHEQISARGYYGGVRLLKAATKRFFDYCDEAGHNLHDWNFAMSYASDIPRQVGLAGSSAIVTAALRALCAWYDVEIPPRLLASLTLSAEIELGIPAGLQDRVIQAHEGVVYMDFAKDKMQIEHGLEFGEYTTVDPSLLTNIYIAYAYEAGEPTEVFHNDLRKRFDNGDKSIVAAMEQFATFAEQGYEAIHNSDAQSLHQLIDHNFDLRNKVCQLHFLHKQMIETARSVGASGKYCGSGGAIIGMYPDEHAFKNLAAKMSDIGCVTFKPVCQLPN